MDHIWKNGLPVTFVYGGRPSPELISTWMIDSHAELAGEKIQIRTTVLTDPETGLQVRIVTRIFTDTPGVDWTVYFTNTGNSNTPILEKVRPLDVVLMPGPANDRPFRSDGLMMTVQDDHSPEDDNLPVLKRITGSSGCAHFSLDEFWPLQTVLKKGAKHVFSADEERYLCSSFGRYSPFFELIWPGGGVVTAIGWTGQWTACVEADEDGSIHLDAGMASLHTYLRPGETIRTPRILQVYWTGDDPDLGYNLFRQAMFKHVLPGTSGSPIIPPLASPAPEENLAANQENQMRHINRSMDGMGFEAYWLDAWWHKWGYSEGMGNYTFPIEDSVDPDRFPLGIGPISDAAHQEGYRFILWFAPETAMENTYLMKEHPEWILCSGDGTGGTVNLGIPEAREYLTRFLDECIKKWHVDIWRTDNGPMFCHIRDNDLDPDRLGILEIRYYEALYRLWDDLVSLNPGLQIDNCCGGGTRIDLETCSRSIVLWRTDSMCWTLSIWPEKDPVRTAIVNQNINASLNRYVPLTQSACIGNTPYDIRSGFNGGLTYYDVLPAAENDKAAFRQAFAECKRLRKYLTGDFYRLIGQSHDPREWLAYQYHLPDEDAGALFFFRRDYSPYRTVETAAKGVNDEAAYELSYYESFDLGKSIVLKGSELKKLTVEILTKPGSLLIEYKRRMG